MSEVTPIRVVIRGIVHDYNESLHEWGKTCRSPYGDLLTLCSTHQDSQDDPPLWGVWRGGRCYDTCDIEQGFSDYVISESIIAELTRVISGISEAGNTLENTQAAFHQTAKSIEATRVKLDDENDPLSVACKDAIQSAEREVEKHERLRKSTSSEDIQSSDDVDMIEQRYTVSLEKLSRARYLVERLTSGKAVPDEVIKRLEDHQRTLDDTIRTLRSNIRTMLERIVVTYYAFMVTNPSHPLIVKMASSLLKNESILAKNLYGGIVEKYLQSKRPVASIVRSKRAPIVIRRDGTLSSATAVAVTAEIVTPIVAAPIATVIAVPEEKKPVEEKNERKEKKIDKILQKSSGKEIVKGQKRWVPKLAT